MQYISMQALGCIPLAPDSGLLESPASERLVYAGKFATRLRLAARLLKDREPIEERKSPVVAAMLCYSASREAAGSRGGRSAQAVYELQQNGQGVPRRKVVCAVNSGFKGSRQPNGLKLS